MSVRDRTPAVLEIRASSGWRNVDLRELWASRELLWTLTWRDLKVRYRQTILGVLWIVGQPVIAMAVLTLLFNRIARIQAPGDLPYPLFALSGLVAWNFVSGSVQAAGNSLIGNTHLISKVYFPRLVIPTSSILVLLVDLSISLALLAALAVWYGAAPGPGLVFLPVGVALAIALSLGLGLWLSALNVEYRDVRQIVPFALQIWMYATPVAYPIEIVPWPIRAFMTANPMTGVVQAFRACLPGQHLDLTALLSTAAFSLTVLFSGALYFRRMERRFADIL